MCVMVRGGGCSCVCERICVLRSASVGGSALVSVIRVWVRVWVLWRCGLSFRCGCGGRLSVNLPGRWVPR